MKLPAESSWLWRSLYIFATGLKPLVCRLHIEGEEHVPLTGGCIITCNHTAGPDYVFLGYASPRQINYMAKVEIFQSIPGAAQFFRAAGVFPVRRGQGDASAIDYAVSIVKSGRILGMFPEGTRSRSGELKQGRTGVARIAMTAGVPVIPGAVINSLEAQRKLGRPWLRPDVYVRFGKPIFLEGDPTNRDETQAGVDRIMLATAAMLPVEMRGEWGKRAEGVKG